MRVQLVYFIGTSHDETVNYLFSPSDKGTQFILAFNLPNAKFNNDDLGIYIQVFKHLMLILFSSTFLV